MPSLQLTDEQITILQGAQTMRLIATSSYDGRNTYGGLELPIAGGQIEDDGDAKVTRSGTLLIADPDGSLIPQAYDAPLSPFGSELFIEAEHSLGLATTRIPVGHFRVKEIPNYQELRDLYRTGQWVNRGANISVKLEGRMALADTKFEAPEQSRAGRNVWDEVRRLLGLQISVSVPDNVLGTTLTHEGTRLDAGILLAASLGGIPYERADGSWSIRTPPQAGDPVSWNLQYGTAGGVSTPPRKLSRGDFANIFIVRNDSGSTGEQIQGRASIDEGPLRAGGPMGNVVQIINNPLATTSAIATKTAITYRNKATKPQPYEITVQCVPNSTIIPGDLVAFGYFDQTVTGEVLKTTLPHNGLQTLVLLIQGGANPWE